MTSDPVERFLQMRSERFEGTFRLRPMTPGQLVDHSLAVFRRHGGRLLALSIVPSLVCLAVLEFVVGSVLPSLEYTSSPNDLVRQVAESGIAFAIAFFVGGPTFMLGLSYGSALTIALISDEIQNEPVDEREAQIRVRRRMGSLFMGAVAELFVSLRVVLLGIFFLLAGGIITNFTPETNSAAGIMVLLGTMTIPLGVLNFLYLVANRSLVLPIMVIESIGWRPATKRNRALMERTTFHPSGNGPIQNVTVGALLISIALISGILEIIDGIGITEALASSTSGALYHRLATTLLGLFPSFVTLVLLMPIWSTVITVHYFDRRVRLEGFDIEQLNLEVKSA